MGGLSLGRHQPKATVGTMGISKPGGMGHASATPGQDNQGEGNELSRNCKTFCRECITNLRELCAVEAEQGLLKKPQLGSMKKPTMGSCSTTIYHKLVSISQVRTRAPCKDLCSFSTNLYSFHLQSYLNHRWSQAAWGRCREREK